MWSVEGFHGVLEDSVLFGGFEGIGLGIVVFHIYLGVVGAIHDCHFLSWAVGEVVVLFALLQVCDACSLRGR
jgi:hypothetical protein